MAHKVLTVFGTRPEAIKLFPLLHALAGNARFVSRICVTAQHREMLDQVLNFAGIVPDHDLSLMAAGQSLDRLTARAIEAVGAVLDIETPDWLVVQGDTTSAFAAALAAHYRRIPVCHVEAGLRSGNLDHPWPEEMNRRAISTFAALHCAPTDWAAQNLLGESIDPAIIHVTGNTVIDALRWTADQARRGRASSAALDDALTRFAGQRIVGVTVHRRENWSELGDIARAVEALAGRGDVGIVFPLHRNPVVRGAMQRLERHPKIALLDPLDYPDFVHLLGRAWFMLTDSGGVQEEAPSCGPPVLVMRETTERPEAITAGTARLVGTSPHGIVRAAEHLLDDAVVHAAMAQAHNPYGDGKAAARICNLLAAAGQSPR